MTEKVRSFCSDCGLENYPHDCIAELKRQLAEMKAKCPLVKRATGRIIPDLTGREHVCEWQGKVKVHSDLSMLDWFPGMAMQGILTADTKENHSADVVARFAYDQADAMLISKEYRDKEKT